MTPKLLVSISIVAASALCAGCAATDTGDDPDWYAIGARDARLGAGPRDDYFESRFSTPADRTLYLRGWEAGHLQRPGPAA